MCQVLSSEVLIAIYSYYLSDLTQLAIYYSFYINSYLCTY